MAAASELCPTIHTIVHDRAAEERARKAIRVLVDQAYEIALSFVHWKTRQGRLQPDIFGLTADDLALDCIADLFQRDEAGRFVRLDAYLQEIRWYDLSEEQLRQAFRRLVYSHVKESLFRRYHEADPHLARIIRNIKNAVKGAADLTLVRRGSELWLVASNLGASPWSSAIIPTEILEAYLLSEMSGADDLPTICGAFARFLDDNPYECQALPLTMFAQIVRSAYSRMGDALAHSTMEVELLEREIEAAIDMACRSVHSRMKPAYVERGKVTLATLDLYMEAVRSVLTSHFLAGDADQISYFDALCVCSHGTITKKEYRLTHRNIFEYLVKMTRTEVVGFFRDDFTTNLIAA